MDDTQTVLTAIKQLSPGLTSKLSDDVLQGLIPNARLIAESDGFPDTAVQNGKTLNVLDLATEYMSLHLIALDKMTAAGGAPVTSEEVSVLKRTFADVSNLQLMQKSPWGQLYAWLYNHFGLGSISRYQVIQH